MTKEVSCGLSLASAVLGFGLLQSSAQANCCDSCCFGFVSCCSHEAGKPEGECYDWQSCNCNCDCFFGCNCSCQSGGC